MVDLHKVKQVSGKLQRVVSSFSLQFGIFGLLVLVLGILIGWFLFPIFLNRSIKSKVTLAPGTDSRERWLQLPVMHFNVYLFNISNPSEVMRGAKPVVQEIGPYCFKTVKEKLDIFDNSTADTVTYRSRSSWYGNQEDPGCPAPHLTGKEPLVVPNVPLMAILLMAEKDYPPVFMSAVGQALPHLFGDINDIFLRASAKELIFGDILIDCSSPSVLSQIVCNKLEEKARGLKKLGNDIYSFSYFGAKNASYQETQYTVKRGTLDSGQVGRLVAVDHKPELPFWRGNCNILQGTDASIFPPFRQRDDRSFTLYSSEVCRVIHGVYEGEFNFRGMTGYAYSATFGNTEDNPEDRCFCPTEDRCFKKGVLDAFKCQGAPLVASLPHFYQASPYYVEGVVGLRPDKGKHGIFVVLEPMSGAPLLVRKRVQLNLDLKTFPFVPFTQGLRRTLVPLFWAEEMFDLDKGLMNLLDASLFRPIRIAEFIKWLCIAVGTLLLISVIVIKLAERRANKVHVVETREVGKPGAGFRFEDYKY